jgi:hypothetical protein
MPTSEQLSTSYTREVNRALADAQTELNLWTVRNTDATNRAATSHTQQEAQYREDAYSFVAGAYVSALTTLVATLTAGL